MKDSRGDRTAPGGFSFRGHRGIRRHTERSPAVSPFSAPAASQSSTPRHTASHGNRMAPGRFPFRSHRDIRRPSSRPRGLTRRGPAAVSRSALCSQGSGRKRRRLSAPALSGLFCRAMPAQADARAEASDAGGFRTAHKKTALQAPQTMLRI